jgi:DNA-binding transcriptional ArsR family regulator
MSMAHAYRALGDPTRHEILRLLREGDLAAGDLAGQFEISWPSVSRHLKVLEQAGLVSSARRGGNIIYSLETSVLGRRALARGHSRRARGIRSHRENGATGECWRAAPTPLRVDACQRPTPSTSTSTTPTDRSTG